MGPSRGPISVSWRRGGIGATRPGMPLRGCARRTGFSPSTTLGEKTKWPHTGAILFSGGEGGIRTPGTVSPYTRFPGEHLKPLSHLSEFSLRRRYPRRQVQARRSLGALRPWICLRHRQFQVRFRRIQILGRLEALVLQRLLIPSRLVARQIRPATTRRQTGQDAKRNCQCYCSGCAGSHQAGISTPAPDIADSICS